jgi:hypothetical protein
LKCSLPLAQSAWIAVTTCILTANLYESKKLPGASLKRNIRVPLLSVKRNVGRFRVSIPKEKLENVCTKNRSYLIYQAKQLDPSTLLRVERLQRNMAQAKIACAMF